MRKVKQMGVGHDVYALIQRAQMSDLDRQKAFDAMRTAEAFTGALVWLQEKVAAVGTWFLRPSVKH